MKKKTNKKIDTKVLNILKKMSFVNWDRYIGDTYYGWIDRKDSYKDFVVVTLPTKMLGWVEFITSSKKYSKQISKILGFAKNEHNTCKRIEDKFELKNCIHLKK